MTHYSNYDNYKLDTPPNFGIDEIEILCQDCGSELFEGICEYCNADE